MSLPKHPKIHQNQAGDLYLNFGEYGQEIELACFSADGTKLLTVQEVGIAKIWDVRSKSLVTQIKPTSPLAGRHDKAPVLGGFKVFIESAALNYNGTLALLGLNDGTARLFTIDTGEQLSIFNMPGEEPSQNWSVIRAVNFSLDGSLVLIGFFGRSVGVWNVKDKTLVRLLSSQHGNRLFKVPFVRDTMVSSLSASPDKRYVFAGFADMTSVIWDIKSGEVVFDAYQHVEEILDLWSEGEQIRWATSAGVVYQSSDFDSARKILETEESWQEVKFSPDGKSLLSRSLTGAVHKWSLTGESQYISDAGNMFPHDATLLIWNNDSKVSACVEESKTLLISTNSGRVKCERSDIICGIVLSPKEDQIATCGWSNSIELWHVPTGQKLQTFVHKEGPSNVVFSPCGNLIAAGGLGKGGPGPTRSIYIWNTHTGERIAELEGHTHQVHALVFGPESDWIVSAGLDRTLRFWNFTGRKVVSPFRSDTLEYNDLEFHRLEVLKDGRVIVFRRSMLEIWQDGNKVSIPFPFEYNIKWLITEDENHIIGSYTGQILIKWNLQSGDEAEVVQADILRPELLPSHLPENQSSVRFEPRAGGYLWRTEFGNFVHTGDGPRGWVSPLNLSKDGLFVVIPGVDQAALLNIEESQRYVSFFPFEGQLRASCVLTDKILFTNSSGKVFSYKKE